MAKVRLWGPLDLGMTLLQYSLGVGPGARPQFLIVKWTVLRMKRKGLCRMLCNRQPQLLTLDLTSGMLMDLTGEA